LPQVFLLQKKKKHYNNIIQTNVIFIGKQYIKHIENDNLLYNTLIIVITDSQNIDCYNCINKRIQINITEAKKKFSLQKI